MFSMLENLKCVSILLETNLLGEAPLSLTTPVIRDEDAVFPGENWFFYWKTSASLWQSKLEALAGVNTLLVPINWSFHSETGEKYDFAQDKPETDLSKLASIAQSLGKEIKFLVPMSPSPFLPNGGVPALLARTPMIDSLGRVQTIVDSSGSLNKLFSFFDPRVYKAYGKFTRELGHYFSVNGLSQDVYGMDCGRVSIEGFRSYIDDFSCAYEQGFSKFLQTKKDSGKNTNKSELEVTKVMTPDQEHRYNIEFTAMIRDIYAMACEEGLSGNWEGTLQVGFLGGAEEDFFHRIHQKELIGKYAQDLLETLSLETLPSSALIPTRVKRGVLGKMLNQLVTTSFIEAKFSENSFQTDSSALFVPKRFFEVFDLAPEFPPDTIGWADLGLWDYLQKYYSWCYSDQGSHTYSFDEETSTENLHFFHGVAMNKVLFHNMLKNFMSGGNIILNRSGLEREYQQKLEAFFLENNLSLEKVKLHTSIVNTTLGDGRLVVFDGDNLIDLEEKKVLDFWHRLISTFQINHLLVVPPVGVQVAWKVRGSNTQELGYEEVRRMSIYNPSSYKKKFKFLVPSTFRLVKVLDEDKVKFDHGQKEIEIELMPDGSLSLDFGVFS